MRDAIVKVLAVDRIARLVVEDEISRPIREWVSRKWPDSKVTYLVGCKACVSVWAGLVVASGKLPRWIQWALALSAGILFMDRQDERIGALVAAYRMRSNGSVQGGRTG